MNRRAISLIVAAAAAFTTAASAAPPAACVSDAAKQSLSSCQNTGPLTFNPRQPGTAPRVTFTPPPAPKPKASLAPTETQVRDDRKGRLQARARALLVVEIRGLENLFDATPKGASDRVVLARRLAEDYVELESAAFRDKIQAENDRDAARKTNATLAGQQQALANQANGVMLAARRKCLDFYTLIKTEYPQYAQIDEVLYYLAYEYEQANDAARARAVYLELIGRKPTSKYIPNAYLAFGELFFNEAQGDPSKWDLAAQAYKQVIQYPPQTSKVYGYAWYKIAYVFWNKGELDQALNAFKKTIDFGTAFTQYPGAAKLADSARRDLIPVYALKGDPGAAYNFLHNLSGDAAGANAKTFGMMNELGTTYLDTGHYPEAIALYKDLLARDAGSDAACSYQAHIAEATLPLRSGNKDAIKSELDNQLRAYTEFNGRNHGDEAKLACASRTAELVAETAMAWHIEAVGSSGQRGTGDPRTMNLASYLYKRVVDTWTADAFSKVTFARIVKDDWPTIYKVKYAMADLLYAQQRWSECGPAFDAVVAENPNAPDAAEAAYTSVLCFQKVYEAQYPNGSATKGNARNLPGARPRQEQGDATLAPKELTAQQKGMIGAFNRFICLIHPGPQDTKGKEQLVEVKFARARTYFEAQHWEEASEAFREIALSHADNDAGLYAAQLYLESANVLAVHAQPPRPACVDDMANDVPKLIGLYCSADKQKKNEEACTLFTKIEVDILRLAAQRCVDDADREGGPAALARYESCGTGYLDLYRRYCKAPVDNGQPAQADRCDELVYNAARAFQAGRLVAKAIAVRMLLIDPANRMDRSPLAKKAVYEVGGNYQAIAVYDKAADWYEKYAEDKTAENADKALNDAVLLRLGLGTDADVQKAIDDAARFQRNYGGAKAAQAASIAFAIGAHYAEKEDWDKAESALKVSMGLIDRSAGLDVQVQAHAMLGRAYVKLKGDQGASQEYGRVRALWKDPAAATKKLSDAYPAEDEGQKGKRLAKALNAVGEALFYAADEAKRDAVDPLRFPVYAGSGTTADVKRHIDTKVKEWLDKKMAAIGKVELEYEKIVDLQPQPPPRWIIAAGSRVGLMWGDFVDDFRRAPYPKPWDQKGCATACGTADQLDWRELRERYIIGLREKSEPIKTSRAKPALVTCLTYSVKFQYFDDASRACEVWLARNYQAEYHVVDELRGAPTLSSGGLDDRAAPLRVGGAR